jgi:putative ABC transport system substrate-binding protein
LTAAACIAHAQQGTPTIGFLSATGPNKKIVDAFIQSLRQAGYVDGKKITIAYRSANGEYHESSALAAEFVGRQVTVITAVAPVTALAAQKATTSIPIVFVLGSDRIKDELSF